MCLAQGHNAVRLEPTASQSRVKHSVTTLSMMKNEIECIISVLKLLMPDFFSVYQNVFTIKKKRIDLIIGLSLGLYNGSYNMRTRVHINEIHMYSKTFFKRPLKNR